MKNLLDDLHESLLEFCLWWLRFDLALARSSGRNPDNIATLSVDVVRMESDLHRFRLNRIGNKFELKRQQLIDEGDV